jgi:hypothetical protein
MKNVFVIACIAIVGCGSQPMPEGTEVTPPFDEGKADSAKAIAGSKEATGILRVANELTFELLDKSSDEGGVGLDKRAADGIVHFRWGDDLVDGTEDDRQFGSIEQLLDVRYVGPATLSQLLQYGEENGYVEEDELDDKYSCRGKFALDLHGRHHYLRNGVNVLLERNCADSGECTAWEVVEEHPVYNAGAMNIYSGRLQWDVQIGEDWSTGDGDTEVRCRDLELGYTGGTIDPHTGFGKIGFQRKLNCDGQGSTPLEFQTATVRLGEDCLSIEDEFSRSSGAQHRRITVMHF